MEGTHNNAYSNKNVVKSSKQMIEVALRGTTEQTMKNRQISKPIQITSSNTCKIPETTGKQPSREGELKCYECGQKGHMRPQCPKLRNQHIAAVRKDDSEEIAKNIEGNLEEDATSEVSEEEEILKREENLNENSGEDEELYSWDELKYKANYVRYVRFISNKSTEQQMWVASAMVDKLEEPVYDHRTRIGERSRQLWKHNDNQPISVFWEIGSIKAHCLIDSGCKGIMIPPNFIRAAKIDLFPLDIPIGLQLVVTGSKSVINYGANVTIKYEGEESKEYFDIINIDYYDGILGTPFLRKHKVVIDFVNNCLKIKNKIVHNQAKEYKVGEGNPQKNRKYVSMKALKQEEPKIPCKDSK